MAAIQLISSCLLASAAMACGGAVDSIGASDSGSDGAHDARIGDYECPRGPDGGCPTACSTVLASPIVGGCYKEQIAVACSQDVTGVGVIQCVVRESDGALFVVSTWKLYAPFYSGFRLCTDDEKSKIGWTGSVPACK